MPGWTNTWKRAAVDLRNQPSALMADWRAAAPHREALRGEMVIVVAIGAAFAVGALIIKYGNLITGLGQA